jgi:spermidine synthase
MNDAKAGRPAGRAAAVAPLDVAALVSVLFFLSGAASLLLETAAMRAFLEMFGSAAASLGAVGGAFLLCMALGAWLLGTRVDRARRPLRWYAALEAIAAVGGAAALLGFRLLDPVADGFARAEVAGEGRPLLRLMVAFLVLLVPVGALGATLPLLSRLRAATRARGVAAGGLQAASTLGAMAGALLGALVLLDAVGVAATWAIAAGVNGIVAVAAFLLDRFGTAAEGASDGSSSDAAAPPISVAVAGSGDIPSPVVGVAPLMAVAALNGASVLGLEVVLFRGLSQVARGSQDSVGVLLAAWLGASALGSAIGAALSRRRAAADFVLAQVAALVAPLLALLFLRLMSYAATGSAWRFGEAAISWSGRLVGEALGALLVAGPAALATALAFPCLCELLQKSDRFGRQVALLSGAWALGAAAAGVAVPALLLPEVGSKALLLAFAAAPVLPMLTVAMRGGFAGRAARVTAGGGIGLAALLLFAPIGGRSSFESPLLFVERVRSGGGDLVIHHVEDHAATVSVLVHSDGRKVLAVNNQLALGGSGDSRVEQVQGLLPTLLHPAPRRALTLGVGAGLTVAALRDAGCAEVDAVELLPSVVDALPLFAAENRGISGDPRVRIHSGDARSFVRAAEAESFDLVVGDLFFPWEAGAGQLYTREHLSRVKELLAPGGLFCQWLPGHQLRWEELGAIGRTFCEVFDGATLWIARPALSLPVLGLVAGKERLEIEPVALGERLALHPLRRELAALGIADVRDFLALYVADEWFFREKFEGQGVLTADLPFVEYAAARRVESDDVVALHNRRRLFELREDVVGRMTQSAIDKKRLAELKRELSTQATSMWRLYEAETDYLLAQANRALPVEARKNAPEELEQQAFQLAGAVLRDRPDYEPAEEMLVRLLMHQIRVGNFDLAAQGARTLELEPSIGPRPRLANLRGMAFLLAWCSGGPVLKQDQAAKALLYACSELRRATALDPKLIEARVNLGIALFLEGGTTSWDEARSVLSQARDSIEAPDRPDGRGLPPSAEAVFTFLIGRTAEAQEWLARSVGQPWCTKIAERMQKGPDAS